MGTAQIQVIGCMANSKHIPPGWSLKNCKLALRNSECACYTRKSFQPGAKWYSVKYNHLN